MPDAELPYEYEYTYDCCCGTPTDACAICDEAIIGSPKTFYYLLKLPDDISIDFMLGYMCPGGTWPENGEPTGWPEVQTGELLYYNPLNDIGSCGMGEQLEVPVEFNCPLEGVTYDDLAVFNIYIRLDALRLNGLLGFYGFIECQLRINASDVGGPFTRCVYNFDGEVNTDAGLTEGEWTRKSLVCEESGNFISAEFKTVIRWVRKVSGPCYPGAPIVTEEVTGEATLTVFS